MRGQMFGKDAERKMGWEEGGGRGRGLYKKRGIDQERIEYGRGMGRRE